MMSGRMLKTFKPVAPENEWLLPYLPAYTRQKHESGEMTKLDTDNWKDYAWLHSNTNMERHNLCYFLILNSCCITPFRFNLNFKLYFNSMN
jgi:hypothetical protein